MRREERKEKHSRRDEHWVKPHTSHRDGKVVRVKGHWAEDPSRRKRR